MTDVTTRINQLSAERAELYRQRDNGRRRDASVMRRIQEASRELDGLWDERRRERIGRLEGIDLLVDRAYARAYGEDYDDAVAPPRDAASEREAASLAA
ncbi:MAG: hypothetical protein IIC88_04820 [Chloroflexi bacterium]|nr:hypothetical protein [Chloroflexota bacterium]